MSQIDDVFADLTCLKRWVPYKLVFNPKTEKFDKIPSNGRHGLSTAMPDDWLEFTSAAMMAQDNTLPGVGLVLTGGIELDEWRLVGLDFDDVNFDTFKLPFDTYAEISPSGKGVRALAWVPIHWAAQFNDCTNAMPPSCRHAEIYLGNRPRFLTITFNKINDFYITQLHDADLEWFKPWMKKMLPTLPPREAAELPSDAGKEIDLHQHELSMEQRNLVAGTGQLDRSAVLHGLLIKLIDSGAKQDDLLATIMRKPALWQYCLDHRHNDPIRAADFARHEIMRAYDRSMKGKRDKLIGFNLRWKPPVEETEEEEEKKRKRITADAALRYKFPMHLYDKAPGLVGEVAHWIMRASYSPRAEFAYACALSVVSCLIGPYCTHGSRSSKLNLYITLVGGTGTGKNEAIDVAALLMQATEAKDAILDFPASEAALRRQLNQTPNVLLKVDELAHKLEGMANNANGSSLGRAILEAYNGARMQPKVYADERKCLPAVENPYVQILGGTTDKIWSVVKSSHMEDGTLNRFLFVCLPELAAYSRELNPDATVPKDLKDRLNAFWRDGKRFDLMGDIPGIIGRKLAYSDEVVEALDKLDKRVWLLQQKEYGSLYSRLTLHVLKVAGILAVGDGRQVIEMRDFKMAEEFVEWCETVTYVKIDGNIADTNFERVTKRLLAKLEKCNGRMTMREAYKSMHISRREMEEVVSTLILAGEIEMFEGAHAGGKTVEYLVMVDRSDDDEE